MIQVLEGRDYDDTAAFVADLNKARLANPQQWLVYMGRVRGHEVGIKTFGNGDLQQFKVDGRDVRGQEYGMNVGQWKAEITRVLDRHAA